MCILDLSEPAERIRQLEADNARLTERLATMSDRGSRLTRDVTDFRSTWSRDFLSPATTQRLEEDCRNLQRKVVRRYDVRSYNLRPMSHLRFYRAILSCNFIARSCCSVRLCSCTSATSSHKQTKPTWLMMILLLEVVVGCLAKRKRTISLRAEKRLDIKQFYKFVTVTVKEHHKTGK